MENSHDLSSRNSTSRIAATLLDSDQMNNQVDDAVANPDSDDDPPAFMSRADRQSLHICVDRDINLAQFCHESGISHLI